MGDEDIDTVKSFKADHSIGPEVAIQSNKINVKI